MEIDDQAFKLKVLDLKSRFQDCKIDKYCDTSNLSIIEIYEKENKTPLSKMNSKFLTERKQTLISNIKK